MWHWIKRWRDWAMHDLWPMYRLGPRRTEALQYSYEKAGLTVHDQPIPWNAEAVLVEASVRLPGARSKSDFQLLLVDRPPLEAESLRRSSDDRWHIFFRLPPPGQTVTAQLVWRSTLLGQLTLPYLSRQEFITNLRIQMPALFVRLGERCVACQTFVAKQCRGLTASAVVTSPTSLLPLVDLGLQVEFHSERRRTICAVPAPLTSSQLAGRQALVSVIPKGFPRRLGTWLATWKVGDWPLVSQRFRAISQPSFQRSLRICDTRFVIHSGKEGMSLFRQVPPLEGSDRIGPCFLVASREPGMAALCNLQVHAQVADSAKTQLLADQETLITDGPAVFAPGTIDLNGLGEVNTFELRIGDLLLGTLSLGPAPTAKLTSEGGFEPADDFVWTLAADEELHERLGRLGRKH
jgi:hypothetical protein